MAEEKILDRANHPETGEHEREVCMTKADSLMHQHRIDEAMLASRAGMAGAQIREPIKYDIPFITKQAEYSDLLFTEVCYQLARVANVRLLWHCYSPYAADEWPAVDTKLAVFGFPDDCKYFQMLWMSAYLTFTTKLFPKWDKTEELDHNVRRMVDAGMKWANIWKLGSAAGVIDFPSPPNDGGRLKRAYRRTLKAEGVDAKSHTQSHSKYRESYAHGFSTAIAARVYTMLQYQAAQERQTTGAEVALRDGTSMINDLFNKYGVGATSSKAFKRKYGEDISGRSQGIKAGNETDLSGGRGHVSNAGPKGIGTGQRFLG